MDYKYYIGIDEVGRGPIAGPVTVCAVLSKVGRAPENFKTIRDSKKLTGKGREKWFKKIKKEKAVGNFDFSVISVSNKVIDKIGIVPAVHVCIKKCLEKLCLETKPACRTGRLPSSEVFVLLDGSLKAPDSFKNQETIVKGDEKEPLIAMASIVAKVSRDWYVVEKIAKEFPQYGFENHKGYGTKAHYEAVKLHGPSPYHRKTFL